MPRNIKLIAFFLVVFMLPKNTTYAQQNQGTVYFTRTVNWSKVYSQLSYMSKQEKEKIAYQMGDKMIYNQNYKLFYDSSQSKYLVSQEQQEMSRYSWREEEYTIRRYSQQNKISDLIQTIGKTYLVEDSIPQQKWKILNDIKEIAGHLCMKAVCKDPIKNQTIEAWFAQDLPLPFGPERMYGLPGMILELNINNGSAIITATKIVVANVASELALKPKIKTKNINEFQYQQLLNAFFQEKIKAQSNPYWSIRY